MLRTALKPRWLGLFALLVAVMVSFTMLGLWQLDVARDNGRADAIRGAPVRPVAELSSVLKPHEGFPEDASSRRIRATGQYAVDGQVLVSGRRLGGESGYWVLTPLVVDGSKGWLAVVRGFVARPSAPAPPSGQVTVTGSLAPGESPASDATPGSGTLGSVDLSVLVNRWSGPIYNAFAFAIDEKAASGSAIAAAGVTRVPPPPPNPHGLAWRNTAYALQWWIFAAFAAYMWFRMVRDDADLDRAEMQKEHS